MKIKKAGNTIITLGYFFFFVSGATALIYEVIWLRLLGFVFGNTTFAISSVLAIYMAGLGMGGYWMGRSADRSRRPMLGYGLLELGIGVYSSLTFLLMAVVQALYIVLAQAWNPSLPLLTLMRFGLSSLIIFIPTFFMGATLPFLVKFYVRSSKVIGSEVAWLYSLNTAGALVGTLAAGYWLLPAFGTRSTLILAVMANILLGLGACLLSRKFEFLKTPSPAEQQPEICEGGLSSKWLLSGMALSGALAMLYEVSWTRILAVVLGSTIYAFTTMLATFLLGLALGSGVYKWILAKRSARPAEWAWLQIGIACSILATLPLYEKIGIANIRLFALTIDRPALLEPARFAVTCALMIVPTFGFGAIFPLTSSLYTRDPKNIGRGIGAIYLSNTVGNIVGSLAAGFLLIPALGIHRTFLGAVLLGGAAGIGVLATLARRSAKTLPIFAILATVFGTGIWINHQGWDPRILANGLYLRPQQAVAKGGIEILSWLCDVQNLFYREGLNSVVNVGQNGEQRFLKVNGKTDASNGLDMYTQLISGHLPHLLHPNPKQTLIIGFGSGTTLAAALAYPVERVDMVEIEPAVLQAAPYFESINRGSYRDPRAKLIVNDGRNHLLLHKGTYDVIISEPSNPWMAGTATLFTVEFYRLVAKRLAREGIFCQWLQAYTISPSDFQMVVASVHRVFPHVMLWQSLPGDTLILASQEPLRIDFDRMESRFENSQTIRSDFWRLGIPGPAGLLAFYELGESDLERYVQGARLHTDQDLTLEFSAPKALYQEGTASIIFNTLKTYRTNLLPPVFTRHPSDQKVLEACCQIAQAYLAKQDDESIEQAKFYFYQVLKERPQDPKALVGMGRSFLAEDKLLTAITIFQAALAQDPEFAEAHAYLGSAYLKGNAYQQALEHFEKAAQLNPKQSDLHFWKGKALEKLERWPEAAKAYGTSRQLCPRSLDLEIAYARSLRNAGNPGEAVKILEPLRREFAGYGEIYRELRLAYEALGKTRLAIQIYTELVQINPYYYPYWVDLADLLKKMGDEKSFRWALAQGKKTHNYFENFLSRESAGAGKF